MILRTLKTNQQRNLYLFPAIGILLWLKSLLFPFSYDFYSGENSNILFSPLYKLIKNYLFVQVIVSLILVLVLAFIVQILNDKYSLIRIRTKLPASLYVIIVSGFAQLHTFHPVYPATLFFLFAIYNLFETFEKTKPYSNIFNAGFFLGIGTLFYLNIAIFLPAFLIGITLLSNESNWRGWMILLIGSAVPYIFTFSYAFFTEHIVEMLTTFEKQIFTSVNHFRTNVPLHILVSVLILLTLTGSVKMIQQYDTKKVSTRKYFTVFSLIFILSLVSFIFIPVTSQEILVIIAIPVTYLVSNLFVFMKSKFWREFLFSLLLVIVILMQFSENLF